MQNIERIIAASILAGYNFERNRLRIKF